MPEFSSIPFVSFLQYSPRGDSPMVASGKLIRDAIKFDGQMAVKRGDSTVRMRGIEWAVNRIRAEYANHPFLASVLGPDKLLVPAPRSAPMRDANVLWPTKALCEELVKSGLGMRVVVALQRVTAVPKSAFCKRGEERPDQQRHYDSMAAVADAPILNSTHLTVVDDIITRGATMLGMHARLSEAFPNHTIGCFALMRTISNADVQERIKPVQGEISVYWGSPSRRP